MESKLEEIKRIATDMIEVAVRNGEPNFSVDVRGTTSTIMSEQDETLCKQAWINSISLKIHLDNDIDNN